MVYYLTAKIEIILEMQVEKENYDIFWIKSKNHFPKEGKNLKNSYI